MRWVLRGGPGRISTSCSAEMPPPHSWRGRTRGSWDGHPLLRYTTLGGPHRKAEKQRASGPGQPPTLGLWNTGAHAGLTPVSDGSGLLPDRPVDHQDTQTAERHQSSGWPTGPYACATHASAWRRGHGPAIVWCPWRGLAFQLTSRQERLTPPKNPLAGGRVLGHGSALWPEGVSPDPSPDIGPSCVHPLTVEREGPG